MHARQQDMHTPSVDMLTLAVENNYFLYSYATGTKVRDSSSCYD